VGLQELWFFLIAALFLGFLVLEGFDFGVGMLMVPLGAAGEGDPEKRRRAVLNTIGPVWDANEVWLITAGAAMFAAFPNWYATVFSSLYLPLLAILFAMILRIVSIEWRGKIDDPRWRAADAGIAIGSWCPRSCGAWRSQSGARLAHRRRPVHLSIGVCSPYARRAGDRVAVRLRPQSRSRPQARYTTTHSGSRGYWRSRPLCWQAGSACGHNWRTARAGPGWLSASRSSRC
jgi:hypothetical protein